jgi:hypothetical protein
MAPDKRLYFKVFSTLVDNYLHHYFLVTREYIFFTIKSTTNLSNLICTLSSAIKHYKCPPAPSGGLYFNVHAQSWNNYPVVYYYEIQCAKCVSEILQEMWEDDQVQTTSVFSVGSSLRIYGVKVYQTLKSPKVLWIFFHHRATLNPNTFRAGFTPIEMMKKTRRETQIGSHNKFTLEV